MSVTSDPRRLGGVARLYGEDGAARLARAHVVVAGAGGVGSWAMEALARSGIGRLTLIDGDVSALSNTNRQLHAMDGNYGRGKVALMRERIGLINPDCRVELIESFITPENADEILPADADFVMDCIDDLRGKTALVAAARRKGLKVVTSGGAGGKRHPERLVVEDLARVKGDPLLAKLRTNLRKFHGFPAGNASGRSVKFGIPVVASDEPVRQPSAANNQAAGQPEGARIGFGSGVVVTGTAGLMLASLVINAIAGERED